MFFIILMICIIGIIDLDSKLILIKRSKCHTCACEVSDLSDGEVLHKRTCYRSNRQRHAYSALRVSRCHETFAWVEGVVHNASINMNSVMNSVLLMSAICYSCQL